NCVQQNRGRLLAAKEVRPVYSFGRRRPAAASGLLLGLAVLLSPPATRGAGEGRANPKGQGAREALSKSDPAALATARPSAPESDETRQQQWVLIVRPNNNFPFAPSPSYGPYGLPYQQRRSYFGDGMASAGY